MKKLLLMLVLMFGSVCYGVKAPYVEDSVYHANLADSGWVDATTINGMTFGVAGGLTGDSFFTFKKDRDGELTILDQIGPDTTNLNGCEYVEIIDDCNAITTAIYSNCLSTVDITDLNNVSFNHNLIDATYLHGAAGACVVDNIWGRDRVIFVCAYNGDRVTGVDASDLTAMSVISGASLYDGTNLDQAISICRGGDYLFVMCRLSDSLTVLDISTTDTITYVTKVTDALDRDIFQKLGGMSDLYKNEWLVGPAAESMAVNIFNVGDPTSPYLAGFVKDSTLLIDPYVAEIVNDQYILCTLRDGDSVVLIDWSNPAKPFVVPGQTVKDSTLLQDADDIIWFNNRAYVTVCDGCRVTTLRYPILEDNPAPEHLYIKATTQSEGDLHLSDSNDWGVNTAHISTIKVETTSDDWDLWLLQNDNGYSVNDADYPKTQLANGLVGNATLSVNMDYLDEDNSREVHLYYIDNVGSATADIYIKGHELKGQTNE